MTRDETPTYVWFCSQCGRWNAAHVAPPDRPAIMRRALQHYERSKKAGERVEVLTVAAFRQLPEMCDGHETVEERT